MSCGYVWNCNFRCQRLLSAVVLVLVCCQVSCVRFGVATMGVMVCRGGSTLCIVSCCCAAPLVSGWKNIVSKISAQNERQKICSVTMVNKKVSQKTPSSMAVISELSTFLPAAGAASGASISPFEQCSCGHNNS